MTVRGQAKKAAPGTFAETPRTALKGFTISTLPRGDSADQSDLRDTPASLAYCAGSIVIPFLEEHGVYDVLSPAHRDTANRLATHLWLEAHGCGRRTCVPLSPRHYKGRTGLYTHRNVVPVVRTFAERGIVEIDKAPPHKKGTGKATTIWFSSWVMDELPFPTSDAIEKDTSPLVVVRDQDKNDLPLRRTRWLAEQEKRLNPIREAYANQRVELSGVDAVGPLLKGISAKGNPYSVNVLDDEPTRIFNLCGKGPGRKARVGGRLHRAWWIRVPSNDRSKITINGEPTTEPDYSQLHANGMSFQCAALADVVTRRHRRTPALTSGSNPATA